jgi:hypothetical protein
MCFSLQLLVPKPRSSINLAASRIRGIWVSLRRRGLGFRGGFDNYLQDIALGRIKILVLTDDYSEIVALVGLHLEH